jgi:hypothetical protein
MNVDNLLIPVADPSYVGEHLASRDPCQEKEKRAHISVVMLRKRQWAPKDGCFRDRLGNVVRVNGRKESVDYADAPAKIKALPYGSPNIRLITIDSLPDSEPIAMSIQKKTDKGPDGTDVDIDKLERSAGNKRRYGAEVAYEWVEAFAPVKDPDDIRESIRRQSWHWKRRIRAAYPGVAIPSGMVFELPWAADYLGPAELRAKLDSIGFLSRLRRGAGVEVPQDFSRIPTVHRVSDHLDRREDRIRKRWPKRMGTGEK